MVADAPLVVSPATLAGSVGAAISGTLATFTDTGGPQALANYSATVDWGDGSSATTAAITGPDGNGVFTVSGSHTYSGVGASPITITLHHGTLAPNPVVHSIANISGPITYNSSGGSVAVSVVNGDLQVTAAGTAVASSTPLADVASLTINGASGVANKFTLDYTGGTFSVPGGITFNGGALPATPSNSLSILGGSFDVDTFDFQNAHDGSIQLGTNGQLVNYTNMTPLANTGTANKAVFKLPDGTVLATLDAGAMPGTVQLVSGNSSFETTTFPAPSQSLTVNAGTGADTITPTAAFYDNFTAGLTVTGAANTLSVRASGVGSLAATEGIALAGAVATFSDPNGAGAAGSYSATINWGDGTSATPGTVSGPDTNGNFTVTGSHTYTAQSSTPETLSVTLHRAGAADVTVSDAVTVSATPVPVHANEDVYVIGSGTVTVSAANGLLANDTGGAGTLSVVAGAVTGAEGGTFTFNTDGSFTYTPPANFPGFDYAQYTAKDAVGDQSTATVNVLSQSGGIVWKFYEQVLNRDPDYGGLQFWINDFAHGGTPGDIAAEFFESTELLTRIIDGFYEQYLGRAADPGGLSFWIAKWRQLGGPEQIIATFASSPEFNGLADAQYGGDAEPWLEALYHRVLNRAPDPGALIFWPKQLAGGESEFQVALTFVTSPEAYGNDVTDWFFEYLGRAPTPAEQSPYVQQMLAGLSDRDIEEAITNLAEYSANPPAAPDGTGVPLPDYFR